MCLHGLFLHSFNLNYVNYKSKSNYKKAELKKPKGQIINSSNYAYVFPWHDYYAPKVLFKLLDSGIRVKVGTEPFKIETKSFDYGSLLIHLKNQEINEKEIEKIIKALANESGVNFLAMTLVQQVELILEVINLEMLKNQILPCWLVMVLTAMMLEKYGT